VPVSSAPGAGCCARRVWVFSGKSFIMSASGMEKSWIVTGSQVAQTSDPYVDFAQRDFLDSGVHSYSSDLL